LRNMFLCLLSSARAISDLKSPIYRQVQSRIQILPKSNPSAKVYFASLGFDGPNSSRPISPSLPISLSLPLATPACLCINAAVESSPHSRLICRASPPKSRPARCFQQRPVVAWQTGP
ncbi:hypothetical protein EE612_036590, partial [Oryza sativa]